MTVGWAAFSTRAGDGVWLCAKSAMHLLLTGRRDWRRRKRVTMQHVFCPTHCCILGASPYLVAWAALPLIASCQSHQWTLSPRTESIGGIASRWQRGLESGGPRAVGACSATVVMNAVGDAWNDYDEANA